MSKRRVVRTAHLKQRRKTGRSSPDGTGDLVLEGIEKSFGGVKAIRGLSMRLPGGVVSAIIGPNGAGKTTLFNVITGFTVPDEGRVIFDGVDITGKRPNAALKMGVSRTFQDLKLFEDLSTLDNLNIVSKSEAASSADHLGLLPIAKELTGNLPYASQKLVALGRAMTSRPKFLLLDEPTSGLDRESSELMLAMINTLAERSVGICLIEHNLEVVRKLDPHVMCLHLGSLFAEGPLEELEGRQDVDEIFFGTEVAE